MVLQLYPVIVLNWTQSYRQLILASLLPQYSLSDAYEVLQRHERILDAGVSKAHQWMESPPFHTSVASGLRMR